MATNQNLPATDSAAELHKLIGDDATATFENDPKFVDSDPTASGSSENLQTRADRTDVRERPSIETRSAAAVEDDDDDEDEDEDDDDEYEDVDTEDEDEDDEDDLEDDDDDDEDDEDDDDEDDEE